MRFKRTYQTTSLILSAMVLLAGCFGQSEQNEPVSKQAMTPVVLQTTPTLTKTNIPSPTSTPTLTITPTVTGTPMDELFAPFPVGETDCVQPCLPGLTLGVTTFTELRSIIANLRIPLGPDPQYFATDIYTTGYDFVSSRDGLTFSFHISKDVVDGLAYAFETDPGGAIPKSDWQNLLPESVMETYGAPTSIQVFMIYNVESTIKK